MHTHPPHVLSGLWGDRFVLFGQTGQHSVRIDLCLKVYGLVVSRDSEKRRGWVGKIPIGLFGGNQAGADCIAGQVGDAEEVKFFG